MDLKLLLIVATMSAVIGSCFGITITSKHYRAEIINLQAEAIKTEQDALVKQLNTEHEWQVKQEQADKEATDEINKIKDKYNAAMSKLHATTNSMHSDSGSSNRTTLSTNTTSTREAKATCECRQLRQERRALAEYVLKLSAKCDEIAIERNELSKRYRSLTE